MKNVLKCIGVYFGYLLLTLLVFYVFGVYVWNQPPTKLVFARIIAFPFILTLATEVFIILIKKLKK